MVVGRSLEATPDIPRQFWGVPRHPKTALCSFLPRPVRVPPDQSWVNPVSAHRPVVIRTPVDRSRSPHARGLRADPHSQPAKCLHLISDWGSPMGHPPCQERHLLVRCLRHRSNFKAAEARYARFTSCPLRKCPHPGHPHPGHRSERRETMVRRRRAAEPRRVAARSAMLRVLAALRPPRPTRRRAFASVRPRTCINAGVLLLPVSKEWRVAERHCRVACSAPRRCRGRGAAGRRTASSRDRGRTRRVALRPVSFCHTSSSATDLFASRRHKFQTCKR